ncbi:MAG: dipeptide/oligopeptide/nickel ABC transporter ATP-binding protein [Candidatus Acidiferrales bacterium]
MTSLPINALVSISSLSKRYAQKRPFSGSKFTIDALNDVSLTIEHGATLALVGESGAGKSTLARCLSLLEPPTRGTIRFEGIDLLSLDRKALFQIRRQIQLIFQDPTSSLNPGMTAAEVIAEPLAIQREGTKTSRRRRALELMDHVGLPASSAQKLSLEFSGGQRQRLAIARALALQPKLLILDEALSNLDLATQESILQLLRELQAVHSLTYVHVSHDLRMVSELTGEVAVMHEGRIVERKPNAVLFAHPEHPYTLALLGAIDPLGMLCEEYAIGVSR